MCALMKIFLFREDEARYTLHRLLSLCQALSCFNCFRFFKTNGLFTAICPSVGHASICAQSAQVSSPFSRTQLCTGQSLSQKGVFAPSMRQPVQLIVSGRIVTPLSFVHRAAVFSRRVLSFAIVAILASHFLQSSPQQPISWFLFFIVSSINRKLTEWPGRDVFSDGLPVMGCIRSGEIIPREQKIKLDNMK